MAYPKTGPTRMVMAWGLLTPAIPLGNGALAFGKMHPRSVKKKA
jgi:hypothetical protein